MRVFSWLLVAFLLGVVDADASTPRARIHHGVHRQLERVGRANIVVSMTMPSVKPVEGLNMSGLSSRGERISTLVKHLEAVTATSQRSLDRALARESASFENQHQSWIMNARYFQGATLALVETLASLPDVTEIREEELFEITLGQQVTSAADVNISQIAWGVARIRAPDLWTLGMNGTGVVIGSIDSGARATHELLRGQFRPEYGWFSPAERSQEPTDRNGHGTHTIGTMIGAHGVGIAPGAQWIACQACVTSCTEAAIVQCAEWMLCPTDPSGRNRDCSRAPHVINNSWSTRSGRSTLEPIIDAWVAAGIVPVFSNGNDGPTCSSTKSPGDSESVLSVGSVAMDGRLAPSSSRGPAASGIVKPDLSAPGQQIVSASHFSDDGLRTLSGTSMAAPHVAGAAALLLSAQPSLTVAEVRQFLVASADRSGILPGDTSCSPEGTWPNNGVGHGVLDVYAAFNALTGSSPPPAACVLEHDVDLVGHDIGNAPSASAAQCCSLCLEVAGCRAFTWSVYAGGTCWFKDRSDGPRVATLGVASASVDRESSASCRVTGNTDIVGNDLTSVPAAKPSPCCALCAERRAQGCQAYAWSAYEGGTCWLKTACGPVVEAMGTISGAYGA